MDLKHPMYTRNRRVCFMTTRSNREWLKSMAAEHGFTLSTWVHWLVDDALLRYGSMSPDMRIMYMKDGMGPASTALLERDVERGVVRGADDDLPY